MTNGKRRLSLRAADGVILPQRGVSPFSLRGMGRGLMGAYDGLVDATSRGMEIVGNRFTPPPGYTRAVAEPPPVATPEAPEAVAPSPGLPQLGGMNLDAIRRREAAAGLRDGAVDLKGPGGPVDDKIDAELSAGETVLPADTTQAVGPANLRRLIDMTHTPAHLQKKGAPPGGALRNSFADGIVGIDVEERPMRPNEARMFNQPHQGGVRVSERPMTPADARLFQGGVGGGVGGSGGPPVQPSVPGMDVQERPMTRADQRAFIRDPGPGNPNVGRTPTVAPSSPTAVVEPKPSASNSGLRNFMSGGSRDVGAAVRSVGGAAGNVAKTALRGNAAFAAPVATVAGFNTDTEDYAKRFGFEHTEPGVLRDLGVRTLGVASDIGNALSFGQAGRLFRDKQGATGAAPRPAAPDSAAPTPTDTRLAAGTQTMPTDPGPATSTVPGSGGQAQRRGNSFSNTGEFLEPGGPISAQNSAAADALAARSALEARAGLRGGMDTEENLPAGFGVTNARSTAMEDLERRNASVRSVFDDVRLSGRQRMQRDAQERQDATQREVATQRDATERRGQDMTDAGFARRDRVNLRGQELDFEAKTRGQDMTARTAVTRARQEQMNSDRQFQLDAQKFGHERAKANFDHRQKAQDSVREQITGMIPHGPDGKPDTETGARYATALNAALSNYQSALERRAAAGDARAAQELQRVEEQGMAALDAKDIRAFVNGMKTKDVAEQSHTGSLNPFGGSAVISDEPVTSMRKTSDGFLGFGGEYTTNRGDTIPARHIERDGSFFGGRRRIDLRDMVR